MGSSLAGRPGAEEYAPFYQGYIDRVPGDDPVIPLGAQATTAIKFLRKVPEEKREYAYAPGKWTTRQVGFSLDRQRARFLLPSPTNFAPAIRSPWRGSTRRPTSNTRSWETGRTGAWWRSSSSCAAPMSLAFPISPPSWTRLGEANGHRVSVRALAFIMAGHLEHHLEILRQRYGIS